MQGFVHLIPTRGLWLMCHEQTIVFYYDKTTTWRVKRPGSPGLFWRVFGEGLVLPCVLYNYWLINRDLVLLPSFFKRQGRWNLYLEEWAARRTLHPCRACKKWRHRSMTCRPVREQAAKALARTKGAICSWGILSKCLEKCLVKKKRKEKKKLLERFKGNRTRLL